MTLTNYGPGTPASVAEAGIECSRQPLDTTHDAGTPAATAPAGASILKRISAGGRLPRDHAALARKLLADGIGILNLWERDFLRSLDRFNELSRKQRRVVRQICRKIGASRSGPR